MHNVSYGSERFDGEDIDEEGEEFQEEFLALISHR